MKHFVLLMMLLAAWPGFALNSSKPLKKGKMYYGFKLIEKKFVKEVDADCYYFIHEKSGARLLKIANHDTNKLFGIAFKTIAENDYGTPHILEHSVLNGSKNFPVKSPFDYLSQGSLNTFLNAMTSSDWTMYPVASMNDKDYFNLMHVYLDAVFNPLIYSDKRILMQEGWHYELTDTANAVDYKGVVYNEMKGAYSDPTSELYYQRNKLLFPNNGYGFDAGGYPSDIPKLTYDDFLAYHRKYYHPDNSYIMLYGNGDLDKELSFIDKQYLSAYTKSNSSIDIPLQQAFASMKNEIRPYPISDEEDADNKTFLSMSFVAGQNTDLKLTWTLHVLSDALVNHEEGPIRRALLEAGIGQNINAWVEDTQQNVFEINVQNANVADQQRFNDIVMSTLKQVASNGLAPEVVNGIMNRIEFGLREGNTPQKGLVYFYGTLRGWMFTQNPFLGLEYEKSLAELKSGINNGYLQQVINEYLINNTHTLSLALAPEKGLQSKLNKETENELEAYKASLSHDERLALVNETTELIEYQQREDSEVSKATIPSLTIADVGKEAEWIGITEKKSGNTTVLHCNEFSNGIVYTNLLFEPRSVDVENIEWIQLLSELMGKMPTESYSYGDLENALNNKTGSFRPSFMHYVKNRDDNNLVPKLRVSSKAMANQTNDMLEVMTEVICRTKYNDFERLKELLTRLQADLDQQMKQNGLGIARSRLFSYFSNEGVLQERKSGFSYFQFVTDLTKNFDTQKEHIAEKLSVLANAIFTAPNLIATVTCSNDHYTLFENSLGIITKALPNAEAPLLAWTFAPTKANEALQTSSKVQYVLQGSNFKTLGFEWTGQIRVLEQMLSTDYLQNRVRVIGGAYGGFARLSPNGNVFFGSYRDPNLKETLDAFAGIPAYLENLSIDEKAMTRYIIGTISNIDMPLTASQKGEKAIAAYFSGSTKEQVQRERDQILSTDINDIKAFKSMMEAVLAQKTWCVYGNDELLQKNADLFNQMIKVNAVSVK